MRLLSDRDHENARRFASYDDFEEIRERRDASKELRQQKDYVRKMAKRFGWTIQTR